MSESFLDLESWPKGIAAARIPANNNTRAMEAFIGPAISATTAAQPGSPSERDIYIIPVAATGAQWTTFAAGDVAIFFDATWTAFAPFEGLRKTVLDEGTDGENWQYLAGAWAQEIGASGVVEVVAGTNISVDNTDPERPIINASGGGGGGGGMEKIGEVIVTAPQTDINFTGLNLDADTYYQIELHHVPSAAGAQTIFMYYNGDTTPANYRTTYVGSDGAAPFGGTTTTAEVFGSGATGSIRAGRASIALSKAPGSRAVAKSEFVRNIAAGTLGAISIGHEWTASTASVTRITLRNSIATGFGAGTKARLYRLN